MIENQQDTKFAEWRDDLIADFDLSPYSDLNADFDFDFDEDEVLEVCRDLLEKFDTEFGAAIFDEWTEEQTITVLRQSLIDASPMEYELMKAVYPQFLRFLVQKGICTEGDMLVQKLAEIQTEVDNDEDRQMMLENIEDVLREMRVKGIDPEDQEAVQLFMENIKRRTEALNRLSDAMNAHNDDLEVALATLSEEDQDLVNEYQAEQMYKEFDPKKGEQAMSKLAKRLNNKIPSDADAFQKAAERYLTMEEQLNLMMFMRYLQEKEDNGEFDNGEYGQSPQETVRRDEPKVGRNDPCPCGSGKKYKKCHGA
jgi:uncharacterized protein YecA (UPF0149 family)